MIETLLASCFATASRRSFCTVAIARGGFYAYRNLTVEAFPDPTDTQSRSSACFPASPPRRSERRVSIPSSAPERHPRPVPAALDLALSACRFVTLTFKEGVDPIVGVPAGHERLGDVTLPPECILASGRWPRRSARSIATRWRARAPIR